MDGISILISIVVLLILALIGLIRAQTVLNVFVCFFLLTLIAFITIYMLKTDD